MKYLVLALALGTFPRFVYSQTFYVAGASAETSRHGGVFTPSATNPGDSLLLSPAGLSALNAPVAELSFSVITARGSFSNAANNESPMNSNRGVVPFFALGTPIGPSHGRTASPDDTSKWSIGFGITPDLLSTSKWHYHDAPGFAGVNYGAQNEESKILAYRASTGVAYKVSPKLSVGATFGVVYNANRLDAPYIFQQNPDLAGLKTLLNLHTAGVGYNGSFGIIAKPTHRLEFGASFRTETSITSSGSATGNLGQQFAVLGIPFAPGFAYRAKVHVELPPSALISIAWKATQATRLSYQTDWTGWHGAFNSLPISLTQGNNSDINSFLGAPGFKDAVPLDWKDQFTFRGSIDHELGENLSISGGFFHANSPVPNSTLSPLTAAIMQNGIAAGAGYRTGRWALNLSYGFGFMAQGQSGSSLLLYDEYSNAKTRIGTQALTLTTSFRL